ncbi:MAG: hypothetical protein DMG70_15570 [Acidobacteria bacterium]|nr:MAG: hypothetical protein DMG70_15570 [Acidobacteriota bacterium]PYY07640.1 MAG: hypothetical protein DMG69_17695 [Acidobacteriota bacterium]
MKRILGVFSVVVFTASVFAQQSPAKNPVSSAVREILPRQQKKLTEAVGEMPADKFSYKPTQQQMSFAHLAMHITQSNNYLCAKISDTPAPKQPELKDTDAKDKLIGALKASFDFCNAALSKVEDSKLGDPVELFGGRQGTRAFAMIALTNDWADHYAAAAMYLRLNGLLPPTAQPKK